MISPLHDIALPVGLRKALDGPKAWLEEGPGQYKESQCGSWTPGRDLDRGGLDMKCVVCRCLFLRPLSKRGKMEIEGLHRQVLGPQERQCRSGIGGEKRSMCSSVTPQNQFALK
jgi:hypothetical protein